jgi:hypothetical protein
MKNLIKAVLCVMDECKGIEKSLNVGTGNSSYKGVSDKDVKLKVGESMRKHGLIILPTGVKPNTQVNTWEENTQYGVKQKQSVFTEVITEYMLAHESGESVNLVGFGHGTDTQDKSAGKATTYALKYTLLYSFLVATGHIDDADNTHSDDIPTPVRTASKPQSQPHPAPTTTAQPKVAQSAPNEATEAVSASKLSEARKVANELKGQDKSIFLDLIKKCANDSHIDYLLTNKDVLIKKELDKASAKA